MTEVHSERAAIELKLQLLQEKEAEIRASNLVTVGEQYEELAPPSYSRYKQTMQVLRQDYLDRIQPPEGKPEIEYSDEEAQHLELARVETSRYEVKMPETKLRAKLGSPDELSDTQYQALAARATKVVSSLRMPEVVTNRAHILAIFREAYGRVSDPQTQQDIARMYYLFLFSDMSPLDDNDFIADYFLTQTFSPTEAIIMATKLLGDEQCARESSQYINPQMDRIRGYLNETGALKLQFPPEGGIVYFNSISVYQPWGMFERKVPRTPLVGGISEPDYRFIIDPGCPGLCVRVKEVKDESPVTEIERQATRTTATLVHEDFHANGTYTREIRIAEPGSWEELVLEALTDFGTVELFSRAGLLERDSNGFPYPFLKVAGYGLLVRTMKTLIQTGLTSSTDEILDYSLKQDFNGFVELLSQRMETLSPEAQREMVNDMEASLQIGPYQFDHLMKLIEGGQTITIQDIFEAIQAYVSYMPLTVSRPLAILIFSEAQKLSPETASMTTDEFFGYLGLEGYGENTAETRTRRRNTLLKLVP